MTSRIKHLSELPKWFDLKNYDDAKHLDITGWYQQFSLRSNFFSTFYYIFHEKSMPENLIVGVIDALQAIWKSPIFDINGANKGEISEFFYFLTPEALHEEFNTTPAAHAMTLQEFQQIQKRIDPKRLEHMTQWEQQFDELNTENWAHLTPRPPWMKESIDYSTIEKSNLPQAFNFDHIDAVTVDLTFPDKIIIEQFKKYLKARRQESETTHLSKSTHIQNFSDWIRHGILPYLDLSLWELYMKKKIPNRVMADAIYPPGEGGEETVRKTTIPLATSLISGKDFRSLATQVLESVEKTTPHK